MTTPIQSAKGIPPHAYSAHVENVLSRKQTKPARWWLLAPLIAIPFFLPMKITASLSMVALAGLALALVILAHRAAPKSPLTHLAAAFWACLSLLWLTAGIFAVVGAFRT